jgi:hypothetical protein
VDLGLIDFTRWAVVQQIALTTNTGTYNWTFPPNLTCGHTYEFYIANYPMSTYTYGPEHFTIGCEIPAGIQIKPGSYPASINPKSHGTIPVAILGSATFDSKTVDQNALTFGRTGNGLSFAFCNPQSEDVNGDGFPDLLCHFNTPQTGFQSGDTVGVLKGKTVAGTSIIGTESVRIVPAGGK